MASAYSLVLASDDPTLQTLCDQIDGKALARYADALNARAAQLGHPVLEHFLYISDAMLHDLLGDDISQVAEPAEGGTHWFQADEGLAWLEAVIQSLQQQPSTWTPAVLAALQQWHAVLEQANSLQINWQLQLDI